jgi:hypothetical protein
VQSDLSRHLSISQLSELTGRDRRRIAKQSKDLQYTAGEWDAMLYEISRGAAARLSLKDFIMDLSTIVMGIRRVFSSYCI